MFFSKVRHRWGRYSDLSSDQQGDTCAGDGQFLGNWGKVKPKWHSGVMVEAVNHHWLHPISILNVYKVIEHLYMLWMGIRMHPYTVIPVWLGPNFGNCGKAGLKWHCAVLVEAVHYHWLHLLEGEYLYVSLPTIKSNLSVVPTGHSKAFRVTSKSAVQ